jgi:hypothetical protein
MASPDLTACPATEAAAHGSGTAAGHAPERAALMRSCAARNLLWYLFRRTTGRGIPRA